MRQAMRLQDDAQFVDALDVLSRVVDALPDEGHGLPPEILADLFLLHASCLMAVRPVDPALGRSLSLARDFAPDAYTAGRVQLARAHLQAVLGHYPNARKSLLEAWELAQQAGHAQLQSTIATLLGQAYLDLGQIRSAETWLDRGIEAASDTSEVAVAETSVVVGKTLLARGKVAETEEVTAEAMATFDAQRQPRGLWLAMTPWVHSLRMQGRYSEALSALYKELPEARASEGTHHYVQLTLATAWCEVDLFRLGRAQECVDELESTIRRGEQLEVRLEAQLVTGRIKLASGQFRSALVALQEVHQRARAAELSVIAEHARALVAETLWNLRSRDEAESMFDSAVLGLMASGDVCALAWGCVSRARATSAHADPARIFEPVRRLMRNEPVVIIQAEALLAEARWHRRHKRPKEARSACRAAATMLNELAASLNDTDRAALRVHPWSRQIRKGLR
jgi:tetratricopeptide (TPR) repeat protein